MSSFPGLVLLVALPLSLTAAWLFQKLHRPEAQPVGRASGEAALMALLVFAGVQLLRAGIAPFFPREEEWLRRLLDMSALLLGAVLMLLVMARGAVLVAGGAARARQALLGMCAYVAAFPLVLGVHWLTSFLPESAGTRQATLAFLADAPAARVALMTVLLMTVVPLFEELVFRGFLLRGLEGMSAQLITNRRLGRQLAVLATALCFAAVHERAAMPAIFVIGLLLGWIALAGGGLWAAIAFHALHNGVTVAVHLAGVE